MITFTQKGDFSKTRKFLSGSLKDRYRVILEKYGELGVNALSSATPVDTGRTAASWGYRIKTDVGGITIEWYNTNRQNGVLIAILLQYGHGTRNGGYVQGLDYVNPAMKPIFDQITKELWEEMTR